MAKLSGVENFCMKKPDCRLSKTKTCEHAGNRYYNYGFVQGTANYCCFDKKWTADMKKCPKKSDE